MRRLNGSGSVGRLRKSRPEGRGLYPRTATDRFNRADLLAAGRTAQLKRGRFEAIAEEVITAVGNWPRFAAEAGVPEDRWSQIQASHRLTLLQR